MCLDFKCLFCCYTLNFTPIFKFKKLALTEFSDETNHMSSLNVSILSNVGPASGRIELRLKKASRNIWKLVPGGHYYYLFTYRPKVPNLWIRNKFY